MMNYISQVMLFQVLFLVIYDFFLSKETFFTKNRYYLLGTPLVSFLLPFIKISTFQKVVSEDFIIQLPEIFLSPEKVIQQTIWYQSIDYLDVLFWLGVCIYFILFLVKLFKILSLIRKHKVVKKPLFTLVLIPNKPKAFSFFNYIFLGKDIPVFQQEKIIEHELVHSKEKHSLDLLFFEFLKIAMWFNPIILMYQKRITLIHEYISDKVASKTTQKENYINNLLSNFFQVENISFINQFYKQSLIKKRIIMMTKTQSKKMNQLKYLVLIPVLVSMLFYVACTKSETTIEESIVTEYQSKIKIGNEFYFLKQNELGETIGFNSKGEKVDIFSLLPESIVSMYFENGSLITEFNYLDKKNESQELQEFKNFGIHTLTEVEEVSFMTIDKIPTFPGCVSGDKKCFSKMVQKHFAKNFDADLPKKLSLRVGKSRIFIAFKIDKTGKVVGIKARAPHPKIEEEVIRVMSILPKMTPGENKEKKVAVKYSIPFTILVE